MTAPFLAIQDRINDAVMRRLSNADAILGDGTEIPVIFDRAQIDAMGMGQGISATAPVALARSSDVVGNKLFAGTTLRIPQYGQASWGSQEFWGGTLFTVRDVQPDGAGLTLLVLEAP